MTADLRLPDYRLRVADKFHSGLTYIVRRNGRVDYISADETPLALSNLVSSDAAELRFDLEDAVDGRAAAQALGAVLDERWARNRAMKPDVEILRAPRVDMHRARAIADEIAETERSTAAANAGAERLLNKGR